MFRKWTDGRQRSWDRSISLFRTFILVRHCADASLLHKCRAKCGSVSRPVVCGTSKPTPTDGTTRTHARSSIECHRHRCGSARERQSSRVASRTLTTLAHARTHRESTRALSSSSSASAPHFQHAAHVLVRAPPLASASESRTPTTTRATRRAPEHCRTRADTHAAHSRLVRMSVVWLRQRRVAGTQLASRCRPRARARRPPNVG